MVVIISDCFGDIPSILKGLAHFNHAKHDVVFFKSGTEMNWNFLFEHGPALIVLKMLGLRHTVDPVHLREAYLENLREYREELLKVVINTGCSFFQ